MNQCFVIGNGESRLQFDLNNLKDKGMTYGCNGLHRDFQADVFAACDIRMAMEIIEHGYQVYTRERWSHMFHNVQGAGEYKALFTKDNPQIKYFPDLPYTGTERPDEPFQWGTGSYAALLACMSDAKQLYFLGFDLYGLNDHKKHNNVYKGTKNYEDENYRAVGPEYWIHQLAKLFEIYNKKKFIFVLPDKWKRCPEWKQYPLEYINYKTFKKHLTLF